jgi:hypothetical protein
LNVGKSKKSVAWSCQAGVKKIHGLISGFIVVAFREFKITVRGIRILSPREVCFYMDEERFGTGNAMASNLAA